tara:strand:- start:852 stop:1613 length:762 start_codon:yes stop_codon:yes gene_type:complete
MTRHYIPGKDDHYKFTRSEYAQFLGITTNALRMRMRHGKYGSEYVIKDGKYLFKRPGVIKQDLTHGQMSLSPATKTKKQYNRGATHNGTAKYTNQFFKQANEIKALNKIKKNLGDEYTDEINEEVIKLAQERVIRKKENQIKKANEAPSGTLEPVPYGVDTTPSKYGSMLNSSGLRAAHDKEHARLYRKWNYTSSTNAAPGGSTFFGNFGKSFREERDSVEIDPRDIPADDRDPIFSSPGGVEESIWRLKNKK